MNKERDKAYADGYTDGFRHGKQSVARDAEIREVLERLQVLPPDIPPCWCRVKSMREDADHDGPCKAARALYTKLQPLPSENPGDSLRE